MLKLGRREGKYENKVKSKLRHGLMGVVIFDHQEVCSNAKSFIASLTNAAVSLANWSLREENIAIQATCTKMYEVSLLFSSVIESFSKEYLTMGNSLKELLCQEMDLDNLNKKVVQSEEKVAKLRKQNVEKDKKDDGSKRLSYLEGLGNAELEFEELKASFDAQNTRHEILKAKCLRDAISQLADGTTMLAKRISTIGRAQKELAGAIPVVPTQLRGENEYQGNEHMDEIVQRTADVLNIPRPEPFREQQATKNARVRKANNPISCFSPGPSSPSSPVDQEWILVEPPLSQHEASNHPRWPMHQGQLDSQMLSSLKNRLGIDSPHGRSYISNPGIEQLRANRFRGLNSKAADVKIDRPAAPLPRTPKKAPVDLPRVEPYAVRRWQPDAEGLYARANLFASTSIRPCKSWSEESRWSGEYDNEKSAKEKFNACKEDSIPTTQQSSREENDEVVYAVLEREDEETSKDPTYVDVFH